MKLLRNVFGAIVFTGALGVLLFVGAWSHPLEPAVPTTKLISSASQSLDLTSAPQLANPEAIPAEAAPAVEATATGTVSLEPASEPASAVSATPVADGNDPLVPVDVFPSTPPSLETPLPAVDEGQPVVLPLPSTGRRALTVGGVPVLMYHYIRINPIAADRAGYVLSVTPHDFAQQIRFLASHGYTAVTIAAVRDYVRAGKKLPPKPIALTFDDGYDDAYTAAMPVLELYHMAATFYIVTGFVDRPRYVTWEQVLAMDRSGMEIASHTVRHANLPVLAPMARQLELTASRATLESRLGHAILDFCYPGGQLDVATEQAVIRAGYLSATTTASGFAAPGDDPLRMPRIRISGGVSLATFARMLGERVTANDATAAAAPARSTATYSTTPTSPAPILQRSTPTRVVGSR